VSLADYQRGVLRTSLGLAPAQDEFAALGDPERFRLYRRMVRGRLREMAGVAFKQSLAALAPRLSTPVSSATSSTSRPEVRSSAR
jgi:hypothetical protein